MVLRRIASAMEPRTQGARRRRSICLSPPTTSWRPCARIAAAKAVTATAAGDLSRVAAPAFWASLLLSQRRERFTMTLLGQIHRDAAAVRPLRRRKTGHARHPGGNPLDRRRLADRLRQRRCDAVPAAGIVRGAACPDPDAQEILNATIVRGAMVGELRPEAAREAWLAAHPPRAGRKRRRSGNRAGTRRDAVSVLASTPSRGAAIPRLNRKRP